MSTLESVFAYLYRPLECDAANTRKRWRGRGIHKWWKQKLWIKWVQETTILEQTARQCGIMSWPCHAIFFGSLKSNVDSYQIRVWQTLEIGGGLITQGFMWNFNGNHFVNQSLIWKVLSSTKKALIDNDVVANWWFGFFRPFFARPDCTFDIPNYFESMEVGSGGDTWDENPDFSSHSDRWYEIWKSATGVTDQNLDLPRASILGWGTVGGLLVRSKVDTLIHHNFCWEMGVMTSL